jgi:hypothetical protein
VPPSTMVKSTQITSPRIRSIRDVRSLVAVRKPNGIDWESLVAQADALGLDQEVGTLLDSVT